LRYNLSPKKEIDIGLLHKKFKTDDVKELFRKYLDKEIKRKHVCEILGIGKTRDKT